MISTVARDSSGGKRLKLELLLQKCFLLFHGPAGESHFFGARARIEPAEERFVLRLLGPKSDALDCRRRGCHR